MAQTNEQSLTVADQVRQYIDTHPVVRDALAMGIVNLSALTRRIMDETGLDREEAILVSCRRYARPDAANGHEAAIRRVLAAGNLEVRTHAALLAVRPAWDVYHKLERTMEALQGEDHPLNVIKGSDSLTIITDERVLDEIEPILGAEQILRKRTRLVELNLKVPPESEMVAGLVAFLSTSLAARGINLLESISVYRDNMFLIEEDDLFTAFEVLNGLIRQ